MSHKRYSRRDEPLRSMDLSVCLRVLDHIRNEQGIEASWTNPIGSPQSSSSFIARESVTRNSCTR